MNFRVDRIETTPDITNLDIVPTPDSFDLSEYIIKTFSMYGGETTEVELICDNSLMKVMIDRFGEDIEIESYDDNSFKFKVVVSASQIFFGWIFGFAGQVKINGPEEILNEYQQLLSNALK